jgi:formylglycine-generating enzyme required for sulfatase activity
MSTRREFLHAVAVGGIGLLDAGVARIDARVRQPGAFRGIAAGQEREVERVRLCWCPPGQFLMGSPRSETGSRPDETQVRVTLTRGFWMAKFEATQEQWTRIVGAFPERQPSAEFGLGDDFPVYWVNHAAAEGFCASLSARAKRSGALPANWEFRLPTEAQWEYACRAGTVTATSFGDRLGRDQANFAGQPLNGGRDGVPPRRATPVGSYPPNRWGLCDMHGNVFEWCRDWYHAPLPGGTDPDLSDRMGTRNRDGSYSRVRRGGAWNDDGIMCRSAFRLRYEPERTSDHIGFRCVAIET